jgi:hypothetical protein
VMLMASSPSRVEGLQASPVEGGGMALSWQPAVEQKVRGYRVRWTPAAGGAERSLVVTTPSARVPAPAAGSVIAVRALGVNGTEGWDWSTVALPGEAR